MQTLSLNHLKKPLYSQARPLWKSENISQDPYLVDAREAIDQQSKQFQRDLFSGSVSQEQISKLRSSISAEVSKTMSATPEQLEEHGAQAALALTAAGLFVGAMDSYLLLTGKIASEQESTFPHIQNEVASYPTAQVSDAASEWTNTYLEVQVGGTEMRPFGGEASMATARATLSEKSANSAQAELSRAFRQAYKLAACDTQTSLRFGAEPGNVRDDDFRSTRAELKQLYIKV